MTETLTPGKRAEILSAIAETRDAETLEYTRANLRDRGFLADSEIFAAVHRQIDAIHGVKR